MKKVQKQIEFIRELLDDLYSRKDRSSWKSSAIPGRVREAQAIADSAKALVSVVKRAHPNS